MGVFYELHFRSQNWTTAKKVRVQDEIDRVATVLENLEIREKSEKFFEYGNFEENV